MIDATHSLIWFEPRRAAPTKVGHPRRMRLNEVELHRCATAFRLALRWRCAGLSRILPPHNIRAGDKRRCLLAIGSRRDAKRHSGNDLTPLPAEYKRVTPCSR